MKNKKAGMAEGGEALSRMKHVHLTRADTRAQVDALFGRSEDVRKRERKLLEKLFVQTPAAEGLPPELAKTASSMADEFERLEREDIARSTTDFFEKKAYLTEAQRRFPELLTVEE